VNVLFVLNDASGGASMSAYQIMQQLKKKGYGVYAVCHQWGYEKDRQRFIELCEQFDSFYLPWWNFPHESGTARAILIYLKRLIQTLFFILPALRIRKRIRQWNIDLVHSNTSVQLEGALAARWSGKPHIWHIREIISRNDHWFPMNKRFVPALFYKLSKRIIAISHASAKAFTAHPGSGKLEVLHNAVPSHMYSEAAAVAHGREIRHTLRIRDTDILIGMVGNPATAWKKHELFIEACSLVKRPGVSFVIFGEIPSPGSEGYARYEALKQLAKESGIGQQLVFGGFHHNVPAMMNSLDLLLHPVANEPFGRVIIEAMAASKPVVSFNSGGAAEIVDASCGCLSDELTASGLAQCLSALIADPSVIRQKGLAAKTRVNTTFDLTAYITRLVQIYAEEGK
jgi:glycosyltransferase involved in cell wall biosynthesis